MNVLSSELVGPAAPAGRPRRGALLAEIILRHAGQIEQEFLRRRFQKEPPPASAEAWAEQTNLVRESLALTVQGLAAPDEASAARAAAEFEEVFRQRGWRSAQRGDP